MFHLLEQTNSFLIVHNHSAGSWVGGKEIPFPTYLLSDLQASMLSGHKFQSRVSSSLQRGTQVGRLNQLMND